MTLQRSIPIGAKIFFGYTLVLLLLCSVGAVGWFASKVIAGEARQLYDDNLLSTIRLAQTESAMWELRWGLGQYLVTDEAERASILAAEAGWYEQIESSMAAYSSTPHNREEHTSEIEAALTRWNEAYPRYVAARPHWFALIDQGRLEEAAVYRAQTTTAYGKVAISALDSLIGLEQEDAAVNDRRLRTAEQHTRLTVLGGTALATLLGLAAATVLTRQVTRPVGAMTAVARAATGGDLSSRASVYSGDELGVLAQSLNQMMDEVAAARQNLEEQIHERTVELMAALTEVEARADEQERLLRENQAQQATIRELISPVIPILPGVLVVPLVGAIDTERALTVSTAALEAVAAHQARQLILDVTGVPVVDSHVGRALLDLAAGVRLLGARVMLVGIRPEVAQSIVGLGLSLEGLHPYADLQSAVAELLRQRAEAGARGSRVAQHPA